MGSCLIARLVLIDKICKAARIQLTAMVQHLEQPAIILIRIQPVNNLAGQGGVVRQFKFCVNFFVIALQLLYGEQSINIFLQRPIDAVFGIFLSLDLLLYSFWS